MSRVPVSGTLDTWPRTRIVELFDGVADARLVVRFADYHALNADVYGDFVARAHQARKTGRRRYSQWTIIQSILGRAQRPSMEATTYEPADR